MIRSFHYAAYNSLLKPAVAIKQEDVQRLEPWALIWYKYIAGVFLSSYLDTAKEAPFIPRDREELDVMLRAYLMEKAIYELGYELNNRPDWAVISMKGIRELIGS